MVAVKYSRKSARKGRCLGERVRPRRRTRSVRDLPCAKSSGNVCCRPNSEAYRNAHYLCEIYKQEVWPSLVVHEEKKQPSQKNRIYIPGN